MAKIQIGHPQSNGVRLYGSQRKHRHFVTISIELGDAGDHLESLGDDGSDTGFKGAARSEIMRQIPVYETKHGHKEFVGFRYEPAPELSKGREVIEVWMSFEQFAEMLCSTGHLIDCTVHRFNPIVGDHVYSEVVPEPAPIYDRAQRRMEKAQAAALARIDAALAMNMTAKVRRELEMARQEIVANAGFVVQQAAEEMGAAAEGALSIIMDKVAGLEAAGRLPEGSTQRFREGGGFAGLLGGGSAAFDLPGDEAEEDKS